MSDVSKVDFGPLTEIIGIWKGDKGIDVAPEPDGAETSPYFETITFSAVEGVTNAEAQHLAAVRYHQTVQRKSNGEVFHDETGYWMWDAGTETIMHSLVIPRAVCVLAGGKYGGEKDDKGRVFFEVSARMDDEKSGIIQSPFMRKNARTLEFSQRVTLGHDALSYDETTIIDIYGKRFEHTDQNRLARA